MSEQTVSATCTMHAFDEGWGTPTPPGFLLACNEPTIAAITIACPHEHVDVVAACMGCAAEVQQVQDVMICPRCEDGTDSHECKVAVQIHWLNPVPGSEDKEG